MLNFEGGKNRPLYNTYSWSDSLYSHRYKLFIEPYHIEHIYRVKYVYWFYPEYSVNLY